MWGEPDARTLCPGHPHGVAATPDRSHPLATIVAPLALTPLAQPESRAALNAECLQRILAGMALPEGLAPRSHAAPQPSSARAGIERILGLPAGQLQ